MTDDIYRAAIRHHQAGRLAEAKRLYQQILQAEPGHIHSLHYLGVIAHQTGDHRLAIELIGRAIAGNSRIAVFHNNIGEAFRAVQQIDRAEACYRTALALDPAYADACNNLGIVSRDQGKPEDAAQYCQRALAIKPDHARAYNNLGLALRDLGRLDEAITAYRQALAIYPDFAEAYSNLGAALVDQDMTDEATASHEQALPGAAGNASAGLSRQDKVAEAIAIYRKALTIKPGFTEALNNLAVAYKAQGRLDEAIASYREAVASNPDYAEAHSNLGLALLTAGQLAEGWREYAWRWRGGEKTLKPRGFVQPQWAGEDLAGRTILLHAEQGIGDTIQMSRYIAPAAARHGRVILEVPRPIQWLFAEQPRIERIVAAGDELPAFDLHCPLMNLPLVFDTGWESIPPPLRLPRPDPALAAAWRRRLPPGFRIGVVWQGNPFYPEDRARSAPLGAFAALARLPGVSLVSLQKHHGLDQLVHLPIGMTVSTLGSDFDSGPDAFRDTTAVMAALDLIVTIDSAAGHLAGSLGLPVWLALPAMPHWPWTLAGSTTPWYPSMRLFRQRSRGNWPDVFDAMAETVSQLRTTQS